MSAVLALGILGLLTTAAAGLGGSYLARRPVEPVERRTDLDAARRAAYLEYIEAVGELSDPDVEPPSAASVRRLNAASAAVHLVSGEPAMLDLVQQVNEQLAHRDDPDQLDRLLAAFTDLARRDLGLDRLPQTRGRSARTTAPWTRGQAGRWAERIQQSARRHGGSHQAP